MEYFQGLLMGLCLGAVPTAFALGAQKGIQTYMAAKREFVYSLHKVATSLWQTITEPKVKPHEYAQGSVAAPYPGCAGDAGGLAVPQQAHPSRPRRRKPAARYKSAKDLIAAGQKCSHAGARKSPMGEKTSRSR